MIRDGETKTGRKNENSFVTVFFFENLFIFSIFSLVFQIRSPSSLCSPGLWYPLAIPRRPSTAMVTGVSPRCCSRPRKLREERKSPAAVVPKVSWVF